MHHVQPALIVCRALWHRVPLHSWGNPMKYAWASHGAASPQAQFSGLQVNPLSSPLRITSTNKRSWKVQRETHWEGDPPNVCIPDPSHAWNSDPRDAVIPPSLEISSEATETCGNWNGYTGYGQLLETPF